MYAEKLILKTDNFGNVQSMPKLPANKRFEAIFLVLEHEELPQLKRCPHPDIVGRVEITGDIINCVAKSDWDLPD